MGSGCTRRSDDSTDLATRPSAQTSPQHQYQTHSRVAPLRAGPQSAITAVQYHRHAFRQAIFQADCPPRSIFSSDRLEQMWYTCTLPYARPTEARTIDRHSSSVTDQRTTPSAASGTVV